MTPPRSQSHPRAAMKVKINGETREIEPCTLGELLERLGLHERRAATMVNDQVVKRDDRHGRQLAEGDRIEVITMAGGG